MFERILVAFDGTDVGGQAFMAGLAIAKRFGGEIYLYSVIEHLVRQSFVLKGAVDDIIDHETKHFEFTQRSLLHPNHLEVLVCIVRSHHSLRIYSCCFSSPLLETLVSREHPIK